MGNLFSILQQCFPRKPNFDTERDIPDLTGRVIIVTGSNTGIGKETARVLLSKNAKVYVAARSEAKALAAIEELRGATGKEAHFLKLDLADLHSIKAAAQEFQSQENQLHVLFNNGGVMFPPIEHVTSQGYDLQFGTNVLGHFYLTKLLLPTMIRTAKESPEGSVRIVNTSSLGHIGAGLDFSTFKDGPARRKLGTQNLYFQSKHGNVVFAKELARRYGPDGIVSTSLNPGNIQSELQRHVPSLIQYLSSYFIFPTSYGALTQLWAGVSLEGAKLSGEYLIPWAQVGVPRPDSQDPKIGQDLWAWLEEQVENI